MAASSAGKYIVPDSSTISDNQNSIAALRLLVAQRKLYSRSKRWLTTRWIGMLLIALAAPPIAVVWPKLAVVTGATAGLWVFLGRTILLKFERGITEKAAAVQEQFDFTVYGMPPSGQRSEIPSREEIVILTGPDDVIVSMAEKEELLDWYTIDTKQRGTVTVAICQRSNAAYWNQLLKSTAQVWIVALVVWTILLIAATFAFKLTFAQFFLGMALPMLPAALDAWEYWAGIRTAARDRRDMVAAIEDKLADNASNLQSNDLLIWQERLFDLRRQSPQVPDFIYKLKRKRSEVAMASAVQQLSGQTGREN